MFKFLAVLASHDILNDTNKATACRFKIQAPSLQKKIQKWTIFHKNGLHSITFWKSEGSKQKNPIFSIFATEDNPQENKGKRIIIKQETCN